MKSINKMYKDIERQRKRTKIVWIVKWRDIKFVYLDRKKAEKFCFEK